MTFEEKKQIYIIRQNSLTNANVYWERDDNKDENKILNTANTFYNWVLDFESADKKPFKSKDIPIGIRKPLPEVGEDKKQWLNKDTPDFNSAIKLIMEGYTVQDLRKSKYKIGNKVADELNKFKSLEDVL